MVGEGALVSRLQQAKDKSGDTRMEGLGLQQEEESPVSGVGVGPRTSCKQIATGLRLKPEEVVTEDKKQ